MGMEYWTLKMKRDTKASFLMVKTWIKGFCASKRGLIHWVMEVKYKSQIVVIGPEAAGKTIILLKNRMFLRVHTGRLLG